MIFYALEMFIIRTNVDFELKKIKITQNIEPG